MTFHLQPKQAEALDLIEATGSDIPTVIGIGGAKGGGKSRGTRDIALSLAFVLGKVYKGLVITIVRRVYKDLADNHIEPLFRERPELRQYWRAGAETLELPNGARIVFRYAETADDVKRKFLGGYESAIIFVDEAQQFSQQELQWIGLACRWTGTEGIPAGLCKLVLLFNPGGIGSDFIRRIFWLKKYEEGETPHSFAFIHLFGWDNYEWFRGQVGVDEKTFYEIPSRCHRDDKDTSAAYPSAQTCCRYHAFIEFTTEGRKYNQMPWSIRAGYLLGSFEHFAGQYFAGVWDEYRCTLNSAQVEQLIQYWHRRWMSLDWGFGHHFSVFWFASLRVGPVDLERILRIRIDHPLELVICYREFIGKGMGERDLAEAICARTPRAERPHITQFRAGTDIFAQRRGIPHTIAEQLEQVTLEQGLPPMTGADTRAGSRVHSARLVHEMFRRSSSMRSPEPPQKRDETALLLIGPECVEFQSAVTQLICDPKKPEDILKLETRADDIWDGFKYGVGYWEESKGKAPIEVRRAEVYREYDVPVEDRSTGQMTALSMAVRKFDASAKRENRRIIRKR